MLRTKENRTAPRIPAADKKGTKVAKKAIQDRRGVSEIKRSEAALKEENAGLRALLQSNTDDKAALAAARSDVGRLESNIEELNAAHSDELEAQKQAIEDIHTAELSTLRQQLDTMMTFAEKSGFDAVTLEKLDTEEAEAVAMSEGIKEATTAISDNCAAYRADCDRIMGELDLDTALGEEPPVAVEFAAYTKSDWSDALAH